MTPPRDSSAALLLSCSVLVVCFVVVITTIALAYVWILNLVLSATGGGL